MYNDGAAQRIAKMAAAEVKKQGKQCAVGIIEGVPVVNILSARNVGMAAARRRRAGAAGEPAGRQLGRAPDRPAWKTKWGSKMTAILAYNDPSALGAVAAKGGDFQPVVTGMNGDADGLAAVKSGAMYATGAVPNVEVGESMAQVTNIVVSEDRLVPVEGDHQGERRRVQAPGRPQLKGGPMDRVREGRRPDRGEDEAGLLEVAPRPILSAAPAGRRAVARPGLGGNGALRRRTTRCRAQAVFEALRPRAGARSRSNFAVARGEVVALAGENGSGESTLAKILAGAVPADGGELTVDGAHARSRSPPTHSPGARARHAGADRLPGDERRREPAAHPAAGCALGLPASGSRTTWPGRSSRRSRSTSTPRRRSRR